jgi:integrase
MAVRNIVAPPPRWTPEQLGEFVEHVRDDRFFALWMLVATTGIRVESLVDLRRGDIDMKEPLLVPPPTAVSGRREAPPLTVARTYALDPDTHHALREHVIAWDKEQGGGRADRLFVWSDGGPLHPKSVTILFRRHCHKADLPVVPLRAMRQAYVIAALETGIPTAVISERLGRSVTPTTVTRIPDVDAPEQARPRTPARASGRSSESDRRRSCHLRSC